MTITITATERACHYPAERRGRRMPRRSNVFQDVVAILHRELAGDATVTESAMLVNSRTGKGREVDVVITSRVAGHPVVVAVEATSGGRPATVQWVEEMVGKHADLPTDKVVLVSEAGFTEQARVSAEAHEFVAFAPDDLQDDSTWQIVNRLKSLWPKAVNFELEEVDLTVESPDGATGPVANAPLNAQVVVSGMSERTNLATLVLQIIASRQESLYEQIGLRDIANDLSRPFSLTAQGFMTASGGISEAPALEGRLPNGDTKLFKIISLVARGQAHVQVREMPLTHARLGDVDVSFGETKLFDQQATIVISGLTKEMITIRVRTPGSGDPQDHRSAARDPRPNDEDGSTRDRI